MTQDEDELKKRGKKKYQSGCLKESSLRGADHEAQGK